MPPLLPTLGPQPKSPLSAVLKFALIVGLLAGGAYWLWNRRSARNTEAASATAPAAAPVPNAQALPSAPGAPVPGPAAPVAPPSEALAVAPVTPVSPLKHARVAVMGPLEAGFVAAVGKDVGPPLTQVVTRTLVWWITMPGDLKRGDVLDIVYEERVAQEPLVHAVSFVSNKTGQTHRVYRYQPTPNGFARYYSPNGEELELRLKNSPLDEYEQITSLLRDGRKHKGVDFRAPVGTPVKAPFAGTITRKNWNFRGNGNCLELTASSGAKKALFLHLDVLPSNIKVGDKIAVGQSLARSGNSGHSFAPHLHYQLMRGEDRVLDPFTEHETYRTSIAAADLPGLQAEVKKLDSLMAQSAAAAASP